MRNFLQSEGGNEGRQQPSRRLARREAVVAGFLMFGLRKVPVYTRLNSPIQSTFIGMPEPWRQLAVDVPKGWRGQGSGVGVAL
jgi:hypothetical protein